MRPPQPQGDVSDDVTDSEATQGSSSDPTSSDDDAPFDHPVPNKFGYQGKNSMWLTAGIVVADVVGAGILGMPAAVARFGWLLGALVMTLMLLANVHISILLWKVRVGCQACAEARTYVALCRGAFAAAPRWQRRTMLTVCGVSQYLFIFGVLGVYLLCAGRGLGMLFYGQQLCLPTWSLIAAGALWPFAGTAREMGTRGSLVWINILTLCGTVCIPLVFYSVYGSDAIGDIGAQWHAISPLTAAGVLNGLSTFAFGMTSQFMLTEIIGEMKDPMEFPKAYATISAPFQLAAFMAAGLGGYYFFGDKSMGMLNENLPFNLWFQAAAACLVIHMLISYMIKGVVFANAVLKNVKADYSHPRDPRKRTYCAWNGVVVPTLAAVWLVANIVPFFDDAIGILGASFAPLACWLLPIVLFLRYMVDAGEQRPYVSPLEWVFIGLEACVALVLMGYGTLSALVSLADHWHALGPPFACHCEGLWKTCACSADHIGMDVCRLAAAGNVTVAA